MQFPQVVLLEAPAAADNRPAPHDRQSELDGAATEDEYVPRMQLVQADVLVADVSVDQVPAMQFVHCAALPADHVPATQLLQAVVEDAPVIGENVPATHPKH